MLDKGRLLNGNAGFIIDRVLLRKSFNEKFEASILKVRRWSGEIRI